MEKKIYVKKLHKHIQTVLCDIVIMMDLPVERSHTNFDSGNSDRGSKFGRSYNFKDMHEILPS